MPEKFLFAEVNWSERMSETAETLLVDMGNQRLKWRWMHSTTDQSGSPEESDDSDGAIPIKLGDDADQSDFVQRLNEVFTEFAAPARVLLSAVSQQQAVSAFQDWCWQRWQVEVESKGAEAAFSGLVNDYDDPAQLGCDRWHAAIAAHRKSQRSGRSESVVVVDAGTAITVDLVHHNHFVGGAIMPGVSTMIRTLGRDTGRIRLNQSDGVGNLWQATAKNSDDAVRSGVYFAVCGGVDRCIEAQARFIGKSPQVFFTGGDAALVRDGSNFNGRICANLVLDGLALLAGEVGG